MGPFTTSIVPFSFLILYLLIDRILRVTLALITFLIP